MSQISSQFESNLLLSKANRFAAVPALAHNAIAIRGALTMSHTQAVVAITTAIVPSIIQSVIAAPVAVFIFSSLGLKAPNHRISPNNSKHLSSSGEMM
jgi:hypothetical protein